MKELHTADRALADAFRAIAEDDARLSASPAVEATVMAAFHDVTRARRLRRRRIVAAVGAVAAVVAMALGGLEVRRLNSGEPRSIQTSGFRLQTSGEVATAFMPLAYGGVPIVDGHIVRMEVPRASLVSFGLLPADVMDGADSARNGTVLADVIVGDDGLARAVRFVRKLDRREPRR